MTTAGYRLSAALACTALFLLSACGGSTDDTAAPAPSSSGASVSPDDLPKPEPAQAAATLRYLAGQGAPVMKIHRMVQAWRPASSQAECRRLGDQLDKIGTPDQVVPMIAAVEDEPLKDTLHAEITAFGATIAGCAAARPPDPKLEDVSLPELTKLVEQRLAQLRATR
jgi:hypothetical protein